MEDTDLLPAASPQVIYRSLSDGGVIFSTGDEVYFGLNRVGARIWELLPPKLTTLDELCTALRNHHPESDPEVIRADVVELLQELAASGLVVYSKHGCPNADGAAPPTSKVDPAAAA